MKKTSLKIFAGIVIFLLILLTLEFTLRLSKPQVTFSKAVENSIDCYSEDSLVPFSLGKNYTCKMANIAGEFKTYARLNNQGYRGKDFSEKKSGGTSRILVIGDSMTFGWGVSDKETYPYLLEDMLRSNGFSNVEVINGGYAGGLSVDSYYVYLKNRGLKLKPDIIILGFTVFNDISDLAETVWLKKDINGLPEKIDSCCHKVDGKIYRNKVRSMKYRYPVLRESHLFLFLMDTLQKKFGLFREEALLAPKSETIIGCVLNSDCIDQFKNEEETAYKMIGEIKKLSDENNIRFLTVLFPTDLQLYKEASSKYNRYGMKWYPKDGEENFIGKRVEESLTKLNINVLDLYPVFSQQKDGNYPFFPIDAHFNGFGTSIVADSLAKYLIENRFLL